MLKAYVFIILYFPFCENQFPVIAAIVEGWAWRPGFEYRVDNENLYHTAVVSRLSGREDVTSSLQRSPSFLLPIAHYSMYSISFCVLTEGGGGVSRTQTDKSGVATSSPDERSEGRQSSSSSWGRPAVTQETAAVQGDTRVVTEVGKRGKGNGAELRRQLVME